MNYKFVRLLLTAVATATLALASTGLSSSAQRRNGNLQITQFNHIVITGEDVSNLPPGDSRIIQSAGVGTGAQKSGSIYTITFGGSFHQSVPLTKTGTGHLILPSSNAYGVTNVGADTPENSSGPKGGITKFGSRRLILQGDSTVVYEFRNLGIFKFGQVVVPTAALPQDQVSLPYVKIKVWVQEQRPEGAMKGWPFARLLTGPAEGISQVEGWKAGGGTPGSKYVCQGTFCSCSGTSDCLKLADSGSCSSDMNCDGSGNSTHCYCKSR